MRRLLWVLPPLCLAVGFLLGRQAQAPPLTSATSAPRRSLRVGPLTCVNVAAAHESEDQTERLARCEARLADLNGPKPTFAEPWPQDAGAESPESWTAAMEEVFATCDLGLSWEAADCAEYPCTGLLRGDVDAEEAEGLKEKLKDCPAWKRWSEGMKMPNGDFEQMDLRCPDGSYQSAWVFLATDDQGDPMEAATGDDVSLVQAVMLLGRRTDAVARHWRCD